MMRKFLNLFSVNDPGWGNSHNTGGSKDAKGGQEGDQTPKTDPGNGNQPVETQPNNPTATPPVKPPAVKPDGPPDLDELWRDFNDRLAGIFGGKKKPGSSKPANKPRVGDIPPPSERGGQGGGGGGTPNFNFTNPFSSKATVLVAAGGVF